MKCAVKLALGCFLHGNKMFASGLQQANGAFWGTQTVFMYLFFPYRQYRQFLLLEVQ